MFSRYTWCIHQFRCFTIVAFVDELYIHGPQRVNEGENFTIECEIKTDRDSTNSTLVGRQLGISHITTRGSQNDHLFPKITSDKIADSI